MMTTKIILRAGLTVPALALALLAGASGAAAQDEPEGVTGNPYYGPGWSGPVNTALPAVCPAWYSPHTACVPATTGEPERAAPPAFSTLESDGGAEAAGPEAEDGPASAPIEATPASSSSDNPDSGPGGSGPVNDGPLPSCPAWYSPHTPCVPASGADER